MSGLFLPIALAAAAIVAGLAAYRGIRRGGARFYTLERESLLRRASTMLFASIILFLASIGLFIYQRQQITASDLPEDGEVVEGESEGETLPTVTPELNSLPPLPTATSTPDPSIPTPTATAVICRGVVEGTFGNGLTLRDEPGGAEVDVLAEATIITILLEEESVEVNGFIWRKVRPLLGEEGWVAEDFITMGSGCEP